MGGGSWTSTAFKDYINTSYTSRGISSVTFDASGSITTNLDNQEIFKSRSVDKALNPHNVKRECLDSEEHPKTIPVILALDVTGSMGDAAVEIAKKLNVIMTNLYDKMTDIEFMIMGIGDLYCDYGPIQISQFESDIRIAEQLDKLWFEFGGGGNAWESYTAAWYMASRHCDLDCWKREAKGIVITMGDERCNPYLEAAKLSYVTGDNLQSDINTTDLYKEVTEKYDVYHINVQHGRNYDRDGIVKSWEFLGDHYKEANLNNIADVIVDIITNNKNETISASDNGISW